MRIIQYDIRRDDYIPVWVDAKLFDRLWSNEELYVADWIGDPKIGWFTYDRAGEKKEGIQIADVSLAIEEDKVSIGFTNGRHRTRWMLQHGLKEIPIGVWEEQIAPGIKAGIISRMVTQNDRVNLTTDNRIAVVDI